MDINLNTLKREIEEYLETAGFAVFRGSPGGLEEFPMVLWDSEQYPDYQLFLDTAKKAGVAMLVFATREFDSAEIEEALEQIEECDMERGERHELEGRLRKMRSFAGNTCSLELAFDHQGRMYVYEVSPDWYDEFLGIEEEIASHMPSDEDLGGDSLDGYFSRN